MQHTCIASFCDTSNQTAIFFNVLTHVFYAVKCQNVRLTSISRALPIKKETELVPTTTSQSNDEIVQRHNWHFANSNLPSLHTSVLHAGWHTTKRFSFFSYPTPLLYFSLFFSCLFHSCKRWIHFPLAYEKVVKLKE